MGWENLSEDIHKQFGNLSVFDMRSEKDGSFSWSVREPAVPSAVRRQDPNYVEAEKIRNKHYRAAVHLCEDQSKHRNERSKKWNQERRKDPEYRAKERARLNEARRAKKKAAGTISSSP